MEGQGRAGQWEEGGAPTRGKGWWEGGKGGREFCSEFIGGYEGEDEVQGGQSGGSGGRNEQ